MFNTFEASFRRYYGVTAFPATTIFCADVVCGKSKLIGRARPSPNNGACQDPNAPLQTRARPSKSWSSACASPALSECARVSGYNQARFKAALRRTYCNTPHGVHSDTYIQHESHLGNAV